MPSFFSDDMALQADHGTGTPSFINGFATAQEPIEIVVSHGPNRTYATTIKADAAGHFLAQLEPAPPGTRGWISVTGKDGKTVRANNVIWGDIFFCSGQSNMQHEVINSFDGAEEVKAAPEMGFTNLRLFRGAPTDSDRPRDDLYSTQKTNSWHPVEQKAVYGMSAICWYTAKHLLMHHLGRDYPIGLMSIASGGSVMRDWMTKPTAAKCGIYPNASSGVSEAFNAMLWPVRHTQFGALLWMQGEDNINDPNAFECSMKQWLSEVRYLWGKNFWVFQGQLGSFLPHPYTEDFVIGKVRVLQAKFQPAEAQLAENIAAVPLYDTYDPESPNLPVHFRNKSEAGRRFALQVARYYFGLYDEGSALSPRLVRAEQRGTLVHLYFNYAGALYLADTPNCKRCCKSRNEFYIGNDTLDSAYNVWHPVKAKLIPTDNSTGYIRLSTKVLGETAKAKSVGYAISHIPQCAAYNAEQLPAVAFAESLPFSTSIPTDLRAGKFVTFYRSTDTNFTRVPDNYRASGRSQPKGSHGGSHGSTQKFILFVLASGVALYWLMQNANRIAHWVPMTKPIADAARALHNSGALKVDRRTW